ncbi:type VI secretion system baseplate subunit TssE [Denitrificimonas caeni]|uniref:Type VI secretion system baseplate subunit TssE n=1 Tax=Denitrificimonas caeni TaxID=521720 RepID=A0AAE9VMI2_9GAMM|nr:type VI secretion system baseplate subunit TssE [Denitrificimonas caeni]WBE24825.1 type VI secretion system baseplate subunit TssE [Denitrificimonas caeni]
MAQPSLYEMLTGFFAGGLAVEQVSEENQLILSVLDNIQRILNARRGTLSHLDDYGLPDMSRIIHGLPGSAHRLLQVLSSTLLKYEPRIKGINLSLLPEIEFGKLSYALEAELHELGVVRFGTEFVADGRVLVRHLKKQQFLSQRETL